MNVSCNNGPRMVSLFSGCGGLDTGFKKAGFDVVWANDFDSDAQAVYRLNHGEIDGRDIVTVPDTDIPECDILCAGFPCQPFSSAGNRKGVHDSRGMLYKECLRIIAAKMPKVIVFENVRGLLSTKYIDGRNLVDVIVDDLSSMNNIGYNVVYHLVNSADYGVPQKRERVIIVGFRKDLHVAFGFPSEKIEEEQNYAALRDVIEKDVDEKYYFSDRAVAGMMKKRETMNKGRAQDINKPCNTVGAHLAKVSLNSTDPVLMQNDRYRRFTPREVARIQSFPDEFELVGSEAAQYRALGNAIPPVMFWHVARAVKEELQDC